MLQIGQSWDTYLPFFSVPFSSFFSAALPLVIMFVKDISI